MEQLQDQHGRCFYTFFSVSRWFGFRLDFLTVGFLGASTFAAVAARASIDPGLIALSLTQALRLTGSFQWTVRQSAELENIMTRCCYEVDHLLVCLAVNCLSHKHWP